MADQLRPLAVVTGASSGIGYELAKCCVQGGFDLVIAADEPKINAAAKELMVVGGYIEPVEADLATIEGVNKLYDTFAGRPVQALLANAGRGLGKGFLDQDFGEWKRVVDTNITGTLYLIQQVAQDMRDQHQGKILITGSIAGFMPGTYQAVYNGSKAFLDSFSFALRHELKETGVTVTCLMPGTTETEFFERADLTDTKIGQSKKDDPVSVAQKGYEAMMKGDGEVIAGWQNKMRAAIASLMPADISAKIHEQMAAPGSAKVK